jgi:hypothetical protein
MRNRRRVYGTLVAQGQIPTIKFYLPTSHTYTSISPTNGAQVYSTRGLSFFTILTQACHTYSLEVFLLPIIWDLTLAFPLLVILT